MGTISVIGAGFSGLSAACYLAKAGHSVEVFEKNDQIGGRARQLIHKDFVFDMGPTWYWMPDIFESFFADFGKKPSDYYKLTRLNPGYQVYSEKNKSIEVSADLENIYSTFEKEEMGSSTFLKKFLKEAEFNYNTAINKVIYKPGKSPTELITKETISRLGQFNTSVSKKVRKNIKSEKLTHILEFPVLFLGAKPGNTPAFYCFMNYADMVLGTWYVKGGMYEVIKALRKLGEELGVKYHTNAPVNKIQIENNRATGIYIKDKFIPSDIVISGADYQHTETLVDKSHRNYSENYWKRKTFAPSALLFYVGFSKKIKNVSHHTLFFDTDFESHASKIYDSPEWPKKPLFYGSFPSITDSSVAPKGKETAVFLIPVAPGMKDDKKIHREYFDEIIGRMEQLTNQKLADSVEFYQSYGTSDFEKDYNAYKGNAYGLANTLRQTAFLRPAIENKKVKNLLYTGQLTVPGPGVPPALISGKIVANLVQSKLTPLKNEIAF